MSKAPWLDEMRKLEGLREIVGGRHEPEVVRFFAEAGFAGVKDDETAWCAAAMNAMLARAGYKGTKSLLARSFLSYGMALAQPREGCIVVMKRGSAAWQGHVTLWLRSRGDGRFVGLGGNQSNAITEAVYEEDDVLGYRWPTKAEQIKPLQESKIAKGAVTTVVVETADAAKQVSDAIEATKQAKDVADTVGLSDALGQLVQSPHFWVTMLVIGIAVAIIYWRWRDHGRGAK